MLDLSEDFSTTLSLADAETVQCDLSLSEGALKATPDIAKGMYEIISIHYPTMWPVLAGEISDNPWIQSWQSGKQRLVFGVVLVNDAEIQELNRTYRDKDSATDVLTFTMTEDDEMLTHLPELNLGEIYISLDWAQSNACNENDANLNFSSKLSLFILERLVHGNLHLLGVHHATMSDYNRVVAIQRTVLDALTSQEST